MRKIILLVLIGVFASCSSSDEICEANCYTIVTVENSNRDCTLTGCRYNYRLTLENNCSGELSVYKTRFINLSQRPREGSELCSLKSLIKQ